MREIIFETLANQYQIRFEDRFGSPSEIFAVKNTVGYFELWRCKVYTHSAGDSIGYLKTTPNNPTIVEEIKAAHDSAISTFKRLQVVVSDRQTVLDNYRELHKTFPEYATEEAQMTAALLDARANLAQTSNWLDNLANAHYMVDAWIWLDCNSLVSGQPDAS